MAALKPDQLKTGTADDMSSSPARQATPQPGRYEIDTSSSAVTFRTRHLFGLAPVRGGCVPPVTLSIEQSAVTLRSFTARAITRIHRTEFGVPAYRGLAGRYLDMTVEVRCIRK